MFQRLSSYVCAVLFIGAAVCILPMAARAQTDPTLLFIQRLAGQSGMLPVDVSVGSLPAGWVSGVPLPSDVPLLGAVRATYPSAEKYITLYYNPADSHAAFAAYQKVLLANGFAAPNFDLSPSGGFVLNPPPTNVMLCRGALSITLNAPAKTQNDFRVSVFTASPTENICTLSAQNRSRIKTVKSPVPYFKAPAGTVIAPGGATSMSGRQNNGATMGASTSTWALLEGSVTAPLILDSLASQLRAGGWRESQRITSHGSAGASFNIARSGLRWNGSLVVFPASRANSYLASFVTSAELPKDTNVDTGSVGYQPTIRLTKSNEPVLLQLARRLAATNPFTPFVDVPTAVYLSRTPPGLDKNYLPDAGPLGSTAMAAPGLPPNAGMYRVFYTLSNQQVQSYLDRQKRNGWTVTPMSQGDGAHGFVPPNTGTGPVLSMICKTGEPGIMMSMPSSNSTAVSFIVMKMTGIPMCDAMKGLTMTNFSEPTSPLPDLKAPAGVTMNLGNPGISSGGASGASFVTTMPLAQLLDSFTPQLTAAGWTASDATIGTRVASRSFSITDAQGQHWQAVLTIYRSDTATDRYYSFLDLTNLTQMEKRQQGAGI